MGLPVTCARLLDETGRPALLETGEFLADRGQGIGEELCGGFHPALLGAFHNPQSMVALSAKAAAQRRHSTALLDTHI